MQPLSTISGPAAPLMEANVNTDVIIRIERLSGHGKEDLAAYAFEAWRFDENEEERAGFVLNRDPWRGAPILLAGPNFGCGSSREGAVWALNCIGIRVIIASSFGGIFRNNCYQNGTLPIVLPADIVSDFAAIAHMQPDAPFTVDLERSVVVPPNGRPVVFEIDGLRKLGLMKGLDDLGLTEDHRPRIAAFQDADRQRRPWIWLG